MPAYQYWATTEIGDIVSGKLTAPSPDAATHLLTMRGWVVRRLEELAERAPSAEEPTTAMADDVEGSAREIVTSPSLPLITTLRTVGEETYSPRLRRAVNQAIAAIDGGQSLEEALKRLRSAFPARMEILFTAGVRTGRLPLLMREAIVHVQRTAELRRRVWMNLMYPLILCGLAVVICGCLVFGVVPTFASIFEDFGTTLPSLTAGLINLARFGIWKTAAVVLFAFGLGAAACLAVLWGGGRSWWHGLLGYLPLIGTLFRSASLSGFLRLLAMLVDSGFSLPEALRIAAAVNDDASLSAGVEQIVADMEHGVSVLDAVRVTETFPRELLPVFRWTEPHQRELFVEALQGAAEIYAGRSQMNSAIVAVVLEPVTMFGIAFFVGLIAIALFLPLIKLLNDLA